MSNLRISNTLYLWIMYMYMYLCFEIITVRQKLGFIDFCFVPKLALRLLSTA